MRLTRNTILLVLVALFLALTAGPVLAGGPTLTVAPDKTVLSPALIKKPIQFISSGWGAEEPIVVNLKLPQGVTVKGSPPGEPVGISGGQADAKGNFKGKVDALTLLMTFFQTDWDNTKMKPDFSKAKPLPPGTYTVEAIGIVSDKRATATLTLLPPPKKKK